MSMLISEHVYNKKEDPKVSLDQWVASYWLKKHVKAGGTNKKLVVRVTQK